MTKNKSDRQNKRKKLKQEPISVYDQNISDVNMASYTQTAMVRFGVNAVVQRSTPRLPDGLIPSIRRIMFSMHNMGAVPTSAKRKLTNIVGSTLEIHPHGDLSLTSSIAGITVSYENVQSLVDGQGNFGSINGDDHAAARYLEARLSQYAYDCFFKDFDASIIDTSKNYTRKSEEPDYLPARYPHFLISGIMGIGWGYATYIPSFNLTEAFSMVQQLIKDPTIPESKVVLFPDDPRGYIVVDRGDMKDICTTGVGAIRMRAVMEYNKDTNNISITALPKQVLTDDVIKDIYTLIKDGQLIGVKDVNDYTDEDVVEIEIILKRDADPDHIMQVLYKKTRLESSIAVRLNFANPPNISPKMSLKAAMCQWIEYRIDLKQRELAKKLRYIKERIHLLEILTYILNDENFVQSSKIFMESEDTQDAAQKLIDTYGITSMQAAEVAGMNLGQLTKKSRSKYQEQLDKINLEVVHYESIIRSKQKIKDIIIEEIDYAIDKYGSPRKCKVIKIGNLPTHDPKYSALVTTNHIKKLTLGNTNTGLIAQGDEIMGYFPEVSSTTRINVIDSYGTLYVTTFDKIAPCAASAKGTNIKQLLNIPGDIIRVFITDKEKTADYEDLFLVMITESGIIKKTELNQYSNARTSLIGIILNNDDKVSYCNIYSDTDNAMLFYTDRGYATILDMSTIKATDRMTKGTNHIAFEEEGDRIIGQSRADTKNLVVITNKGFGKMSNMSDLQLAVKPRTPLTKMITVAEDDSINVMQAISEGDHKIVDVTMQSGKVISVEAISIDFSTRISRGKKLVPVPKGDSIVKIKLRG